MDGALKMHHSFAGMDAPGDTQPDSQIYRQYTSGIYASAETPMLGKMRTPKSLFTEHVDDDDENDSPTDDIEMVASSQDQQTPTVTSPTVMHDDDPVGALPPSLYAPTSPLKFDTPAIASRKRTSSGPMLSSAVRSNTTPSTVASAAAAFAGFGVGSFAPMSLTQAWQNTQAPTSPAPVEASEDLVFTRPSPNFSHARHSSPIPALSSPIKATQDDTPRTDPVIRSSSEPRTEYVSMKESQERRKRTIRELPIKLVEQDSWEKPSALQLRIQKKKSRENLERKAAMSFAHISAPIPLSPDTGNRRSVRSLVLSPKKSKPSRSVVRSHGDNDNDDDSTEELAQAMTVNDGLVDDDSADELSQHVPFMARPAAKYNTKDNSVQVPKTSSHPTRTQSDQPHRNSSQLATPTSQLERVSQPQAPASQPLSGSLRPHSSRESVAIMDSQPDATANYESIPRPKSLRFPSSPSINQYSINQTTMGKTGFTSQVSQSSVPPLPPIPSSDEEAVDADENITPQGEEGVPSSPPISAVDEDLTYDEHERAYDEYAEEEGVRDSIEPEIADDEAPNEDDDDLPLTKPEPEEDDDTEMKEADAEEDGELDLVQPRKVDLGTDQEIPETLEQEHPLNAHSEEHEPAHSLPTRRGSLGEGFALPRPPPMQRQNTIPETDALEDTQPSFMPDVNSAGLGQEYNLGEPGQTNITEPFHTTNEQLSGSQHDRPLPLSSNKDGSDAIQAGERLRSLQEIYDMPDTQPSVMEEEIEMPRLSGLDEEDETSMALSSPAPPSIKRRKVTYTAKHNVFQSPTKPMAVIDQKPRQPSPSRPKQTHPVYVDTPPTASAQERELQGGHAALHAREEAQAPYVRQATLKSKPAPRPSRSQKQKKGALKAVPRELIHSMSSPAASPSKPRSATDSRTSAPVTPTKRGGHNAIANNDVPMADVEDEQDELADVTPDPVTEETATRREINHDEQDKEGFIAPNRVFASWPGSHFYPATCIGRVVGRHLQIRFDDGNTTNLEPNQIRALDLQPGDHVKVDEPGKKKHTYIVVALKDKVEDVDREDSPTTDRHGYTTVVVEEKRRDSLPAAKAAQPVKHISVSMGSIYLTTQLWTRLRNRSFNFSPPTSPSKSTSHLGTPINPAPIATPSFSRRGTTVPSLLKDATARAASVTSSSTRSGTGVFSNMAFVLTSTAMDVDKEEIARCVKLNGGLVLEQGFHELFDHESAGMPASSQSRRRSESVAEGSVGLTLKPMYKDLGFVALISDSHSRSTKYIQALALNVPCLHLRWVQDSLNASRAAPFLKYLLPAGVSKFLDPNGVVRSRTMIPYDPAAEDLSFAQTISDRDLLLRNQTVLLITGKSKKEVEKRQPFIFLTHALGSANVGRCADLAGATQMLQKGHWDWIYVDNGETRVADAAAELFGTGKPAASEKSKKSKKRKREEAEQKEDLVARGEVAGKRVKITCAEFVIQSLILGALVEE
jgi:hypothetical protein